MSNYKDPSNFINISQLHSLSTCNFVCSCIQNLNVLEFVELIVVSEKERARENACLLCFFIESYCYKHLAI